MSRESGGYAGEIYVTGGLIVHSRARHNRVKAGACHTRQRRGRLGLEGPFDTLGRILHGLMTKVYAYRGSPVVPTQEEVDSIFAFKVRRQ